MLLRLWGLRVSSERRALGLKGLGGLGFRVWGLELRVVLWVLGYRFRFGLYDLSLRLGLEVSV